MSEKKERKMTPKGFLAKTTTKAANSAWAFLSQYREYLTTGELKDKASPILVKLDSARAEALSQMKDCEGLAKASLKEIQNAVMTHIIESDARKMEKVQEQAQEPGSQTKKPWIATIYNADGEVQTRIKDNGDEEDLIKGFDLSQAADRWCDRRLFDGRSDWYAEVTHASLPIHTRIERQESIARILKQPKGPTVQVKGKSTKTLGFQHKAKDLRVFFSRG